jgi:superfamily II DNA/RNA helicase
MKIPSPLLKFLKSKRIVEPTPIQLQGLPVAFAGRDMIGIAFTGSGKTLAFCLPLIMLALEDEARLPLVRGEGPVGIVLCPSRELASQTYENIQQWAAALAGQNAADFPRLNVLLCMGGIAMGEQAHVLGGGIHIVVATPGRLIDMLEKRKFNFDICRYMCMDEADRMIDLGFEDDVRNIMSFFKVRAPSPPLPRRRPARIAPHSASARRSSSARRCRARSRTLRSSRSCGPCSSTSGAPARRTSTCCRRSSTSSRRPRWCTCSSACRRRRRP